MKKKRTHVAYSTYRRLVLEHRRTMDLLDEALVHREMLAKLAAKEPMFYNPLEAFAAERVRDKILACLRKPTPPADTQ